MSESVCVDCGVNTTPSGEYGEWEWYMVRDEVWTNAGMAPNGFLCVGCLEERLGRGLAPADFAPYPINEPSRLNSGRLNARLGRQAA